MRKTFIFLLLILLIGFFLRFYRLGDYPVGFHRDEAFLGYNAYSLLKTGKDMSGDFLPLHLQSFIYSPAGYSYFSIPFIAVFDLNAFSVRFASASFGVLTVLMAYLLAAKIMKNSVLRYKVAIFSSLFLAISPWHINLSRTATENTIVVFFISFGVYLFLRWLEDKTLLFTIGSFLSFGITLLVYQASRAFLPLLIPLMFFCYFNNIKKQFNKLIIPILLFILIIIFPLILILNSPNLALRIRTVSIFASGETQLKIDEELRRDGMVNTPIFVSRTFHNKITGYIDQVIQNYFKHLSYDFFFTDQAYPDRYRIPQVGLLYFYEFPLFTAGLFFIFKNQKRSGFFLLGWVMLSFAGSALTFDDVPNMQRTMIVFPAISIISATGFVYLINFLHSKKKLMFVSSILVIIIIYNLSFYLHQYYVHYSSYRPWYRNDGYRDLVKVVNSHIVSYKKATITNRESAPTIFFLFFSKYNPAAFQKEIDSINNISFDRVSFSKYEFSQEECPLKIDIKTQKSIGAKNVLYVNSSLCKIPQDVKVLDIVRRTDNSEVFQILSVN